MKVYLADSFWKRLKGLLNFKKIEEDECMLFNKTSSVHSIGMKFPIAVFYFDKNKELLKKEYLEPNRIGSFVKDAYYVIETHPVHLKKPDKIRRILDEKK